MSPVIFEKVTDTYIFEKITYLRLLFLYCQTSNFMQMLKANHIYTTGENVSFTGLKVGLIMF